MTESAPTESVLVYEKKRNIQEKSEYVILLLFPTLRSRLLLLPVFSTSKQAGFLLGDSSCSLIWWPAVGVFPSVRHPYFLPLSNSSPRCAKGSSLLPCFSCSGSRRIVARSGDKNDVLGVSPTSLERGRGRDSPYVYRRRRRFGRFRVCLTVVLGQIRHGGVSE